MCMPKSGIVFQNEVWMPLDTDSHSEMLALRGIRDNFHSPEFVKIEVPPIDGDYFNHDLANWKIHVDQDYIPDWFCIESFEEEIMRQLAVWFKARFVIDSEIKQIDSGLWYLKNGVIETMRGNSIVQSMCDNSIVRNMLNNSAVHNMQGNSVVQSMYVSSVVRNMLGNSAVQNMRDNSVVQDMRDNSTVQYMWDNSIVRNMQGNSAVQYMWDNSIVRNMLGNSAVQYMWGNSIVQDMWDNSIVRNMQGNSFRCKDRNLYVAADSSLRLKKHGAVS